MNRTDIQVWPNLGDKALLAFFEKWSWIRSPQGPVSIDFRGCNFIAPWAVCLFAGYALWLRHMKRRQVQLLIDPSTVAGNYLNHSGFCEVLEHEAPSNEELPDEERIAKLTQINRSEQIPRFANRVMDILRLEDQEVSGAVKYALIELLRNVVQHSRSRIGGLAIAQYYPNTGIVDLVVCDGGTGIKDTLQPKYPEIDSDLKAVKFASQAHVSGTFRAGAYSRMHENAGLGLFFIKQITSLSGGGFFLASGSAISDVWGDIEGNQQRIYRSSKKGGWPGTFALLQLRRDTIGDFDAVLSTCRRLAEEARRDSAASNLDFIEDVPDVEGLEVVRVSDFEEDVEEAARVRQAVIEKTLDAGKVVVLDFSELRFATQSFVHALIYKVLRDGKHVASGLSIANCSASTREAILAVAGYANAGRAPLSSVQEDRAPYPDGDGADPRRNQTAV